MDPQRNTYSGSSCCQDLDTPGSSQHEYPCLSHIDDHGTGSHISHALPIFGQGDEQNANHEVEKAIDEFEKIPDYRLRVWYSCCPGLLFSRSLEFSVLESAFEVMAKYYCIPIALSNHTSIE